MINQYQLYHSKQSLKVLSQPFIYICKYLYCQTMFLFITNVQDLNKVSPFKIAETLE